MFSSEMLTSEIIRDFRKSRPGAAAIRHVKVFHIHAMQPELREGVPRMTDIDFRSTSGLPPRRVLNKASTSQICVSALAQVRPCTPELKTSGTDFVVALSRLCVVMHPT